MSISGERAAMTSRSPSNQSAGFGGDGPESEWRTPVRVSGARATAAFLIATVADQESTAAERAAALWNLIEGGEEFADSLTDADLLRLRDVLLDLISPASGVGTSLQTLLPDESATPVELIEGTNVRSVAVPPGVDDTRVVVGMFGVDRPGRYLITSEYSFLSDGSAVIEIVDQSDGSIRSSRDLSKGRHALSTVVLDISSDENPSVYSIGVVNSSGDSSVDWFQSTIAIRPPSTVGASLSNRLHRSVERVQRLDPSAVLTPTTSEPLTLGDVDRLAALRDKFAGERIFVMGNGPSLNRTPLHLLENDYVFAVNRVSLLFERISWRPTFFTAFDVRVVPDNRDEFANLDLPYKFFSARYKELMGYHPSHYWYHTKGFYEGFEGCFEPSVPFTGFGGGGTIAVIAIELAFYMGFHEIYLIGTDVSYSIPDTVAQSGPDQFGDGVKLELQSTQDDDVNHFDPRYFGRDKKWHNPNVREMKIGFARAASYIERRGGVLRNATVGGELDQVRRVDFESLF